MATISTYSNNGAEEQIYGGKPTIITRDPRVLPQQIRDLYSQSEQYRLAFSANWFLNIAFYMGFQNVAFSWSRKELTQVAQSGGFMVIANRIQPAVRTFIANLIKNKPTINAIAPTMETVDVNSAEITEALMEYWYRNKSLQEIYEEIALWMCTCGTAFAKLQWNPAIGPSQIYTPLGVTQQPMSPSSVDGHIMDGSEPSLQLTPEGDPQTIFQGDVDVVPLSPFEVHTVPHTISHWRQTRAIIQVTMKHVDWIADNYANGNQVRPEKNMTMGSFYQNRIRGLVSPDFADFIGAGNIDFDDHALVMEYRELKSKKFPGGRQVTIANGVTLGDTDNPYAAIFPQQLELGYVPFHCIKVPGRFWSIGIVEPLRPLQVEYNKVRTEIIKNRITVGRNKILAPNGSGITPDDWANYHGIVIPYNHGFKPEIMPAAPLPTQTENELHYNLQDMDDVSGVHELSRGTNPQNVRSGLHANILLEADSTKIGPIIYGVERGIHLINLGMVAMAKKFYSEKRTIRIVGRDRQVSVMDFMGTDLTVDLELVPGSAFPRSRAAEQETITSLWKEGLFVDSQGRPDAKRVLQLLQLGPVSTMGADEDQDKKNQQWENAQFLQGMYLQPRTFDDHIVHIDEVDKYMKRQDFRFISPKIQALFEYHKRTHIDMLLAQTQNAPNTNAAAMPNAGLQPTPAPTGGMGGGNGISRPRDAINRTGK